MLYKLVKMVLIFLLLILSNRYSNLNAQSIRIKNLPVISIYSDNLKTIVDRNDSTKTIFFSDLKNGILRTGDSLNIATSKFIVNKSGNIKKWGNISIADMPNDSTKALFGNGAWKVITTKTDTSLNYSWTGQHTFESLVQFSGGLGVFLMPQDPTYAPSEGQLAFDYGSTSKPYWGIGGGDIRTFASEEWVNTYIDTTKIGYLAKANSWTYPNTFNNQILFDTTGTFNLPTNFGAAGDIYRDGNDFKFINGSLQLKTVALTSDLLSYFPKSDTTKIMYLAKNETITGLKTFGSGLIFNATGYFAAPNTPQTTTGRIWYRDSRVRYYNGSNKLALVDSSDLLSYTPTSRELTINGTSHDLSSDPSWTVGDVSTGGSYSDPSWITSLSATKLTAGSSSGFLQFALGEYLISNSGSTLTNLNASNLASGTVGTARLGTGTASSTTFLRGDSTWASPTATVDQSADYNWTGQQLFSDDIVYPWESATISSSQLDVSGKNSIKINPSSNLTIVEFTGTFEDGQQVTLMNIHATNTITFDESSGYIRINGVTNLVLKSRDNATFRYYASDGEWMCISYVVTP
jgi:hypothetical protein